MHFLLDCAVYKNHNKILYFGENKEGRKRIFIISIFYLFRCFLKKPTTKTFQHLLTYLGIFGLVFMMRFLFNISLSILSIESNKKNLYQQFYLQGSESFSRVSTSPEKKCYFVTKEWQEIEPKSKSFFVKQSVNCNHRSVLTIVCQKNLSI